jgi:hypothetical protein
VRAFVTPLLFVFRWVRFDALLGDISHICASNILTLGVLVKPSSSRTGELEVKSLFVTSGFQLERHRECEKVVVRRTRYSLPRTMNLLALPFPLRVFAAIIFPILEL